MKNTCTLFSVEELNLNVSFFLSMKQVHKDDS